MSIKIMQRVWDTPLPYAEKLVLLALADNSNDEGFCYPSVATLGRKCGMSDRTVQRVIARLVEALHVTVRAKPPRSNTYSVHPRGSDSTTSGCQGVNASPRQVVTPTDRRTEGVTGSPSPRQPVTTLRQADTPHPVSVSPNPSESVRNHQRTSEGGPLKVGMTEPEAVRVARALQLLEQLPSTPLGDLARMFRCSVESITKALQERGAA